MWQLAMVLTMRAATAMLAMAAETSRASEHASETTAAGEAAGAATTKDRVAAAFARRAERVSSVEAARAP